MQGVSFGLNTLENFLAKALGQMEGKTLRCVVYNVNLDYVLSLFKRYKGLQKVSIVANEEHLKHSGSQTDELIGLIRKGIIRIHCVSENQRVIHAKGYFVDGENGCILVGLGSPNLTRSSGQNMELLVEFEPPFHEDVANLWTDIISFSRELELPSDEPPPTLFRSDIEKVFEVDPSLVSDLWEHQKVIVEWLSGRKRAIVNIPPGTGKTRIALSYLQHMLPVGKEITTIVLVPTTTLIEQWIGILEAMGFDVYEGGTTSESYSEYLARPEQRILVTLYSRFKEHHLTVADGLSLVGCDCLLFADECHNLYSMLDTLENFEDVLTSGGVEYYHLGLSATIDSFRTQLVERYLSHCGGPASQFAISLPSFYSRWNDLNKGRPILKEVEYEPHFCRLSKSEMQKYEDYTRRIAMEMDSKGIGDADSASAAFMRAYHVRSSKNGIRELRRVLDDSIEEINDCFSLVFVQTNKIAEMIRDHLTAHTDWKPDSSAYVYDSKHPQKYLDYAMDRFASNKGFCLIAEQMLAEGFDLPSISLIVLHGSHRSERDWVQKIGRALRYDPREPEAPAKIIDLVFCDPEGSVLPMELDRYETLQSISYMRE